MHNSKFQSDTFSSIIFAFGVFLAYASKSCKNRRESVSRNPRKLFFLKNYRTLSDDLKPKLMYVSTKWKTMCLFIYSPLDMVIGFSPESSFLKFKRFPSDLKIYWSKWQHQLYLKIFQNLQNKWSIIHLWGTLHTLKITIHW